MNSHRGLQRLSIVILFAGTYLAPAKLRALPSFARQTGQKCAACHAGGNWPQLTSWGRFFKLSGYTAGSRIVDSEHEVHIPVGLLGQAGLTWAAQPSDAQGGTVVEHNGIPQAYQFTAEFGAGITNFLGAFYEYQLGNTFPGWKGTSGAVDVRAVHTFHAGTNEILTGIDTNNNPTLQDVWNSSPDWGFPFYTSPQSPVGPASPMITSLGGQTGGIGAYALINRKFYLEASFYRASTGFFRWMTAGNSVDAPGKNYLQGYNPYWRAYWQNERGPHSFMAGTFGMRARVYPDSTAPAGPADQFTDYGVDSQYQYLGATHKITLRANYIYERQLLDASFATGLSGTATGNLKSLNFSGSYAYDNAWGFQAGYFLTNGNNDAVRYAISTPDGDQVTASPETAGYVLEADRHITQNIQLIAQYRGYVRFNGLRHNIDGMGRKASDNNTLWLTVFFAF